MTISPAAKNQMPQIEALYKSAFPQSERKPFGLMMRKASQGQMEILAVEEDGFAGLVITVLYNDLVLVDYFAIIPSRRNEGLGSKALSLIAERYAGKRIFLEIELELDSGSDDIKQRRKNFYLRAGLECTGVKVSVFGVQMELFTFGPDVSFDDYKTLYNEVFGRLISPAIRRI